MRFLNQLFGLTKMASHGRQAGRPASHCRARFELEMLEGRALMTGIAGVSLSYGQLMIQAPAGSHGNVAAVSIDPSNNYVKVTMNGQSEEFNPTSVGTILYVGGSGGGDTFVDGTALPSREFGQGGNNTFTGGTGLNYAYLWGTNNTYNAQSGSFTDVFEFSGPAKINNPKGAGIQIYTE
jgi:hypothetical protein